MGGELRWHPVLGWVFAEHKNRRVWGMRIRNRKKPKGGTLPGMNRRGRPTPRWVFVLHLVVVFACTWGAMLAFSAGHRIVGSVLAGVWVVAFVVTSLDNVRIAAFEWTEIYVMVVIDTLGITGKTKRIEDKGVPNVSAEPPLSDLDVDRG